jgi:hypothetical protein
LYGAPEPLAVGLPPGTVGLRVLDRRRMALDAYSKVDANIKGFLVGEP